MFVGMMFAYEGDRYFFTCRSFRVFQMESPSCQLQGVLTKLITCLFAKLECFEFRSMGAEFDSEYEVLDE